MSGHYGIKETKEGITAGFLVAALLTTRLNDGLQVGEDLGAIFGKWQSDEDFKRQVMAGIEGSKNIPAEIKDIDLNEGFELSGHVLLEGKKIIEALAK